MAATTATRDNRCSTLVCTPAGFGKTTLLGEWARSSKRPVAWPSLDGGDNDPARFWRYVAAALDQVRPGIDQRVGALLRGPEPAALEAVVTVVINHLAGLPEEATLILDDYHLIEASPIHHSLELVLERLPAQVRLVLAARADPPLPLARLRARGQLAELRERDLRFTTEETTALLQEMAGLELPAASLAALSARTEGWAAGLQLAVLSLQQETDRAGFVAGFSGSHRYVLDYLSEEVLARQPEQLVRFLLETLVLERLSGALCDAVTGRTDSQQLLEQVERAGLFLVALDEVRGWWRYHQLFADLLRARLRREQPDRVPGLHRAAAAWSEQHGLADEAVRHAVAAGDTDWAARLVERHVEALYRRSEAATLQRWFAALPADLVRSRPRLCLALAAGANIAGRLEEVEQLVADAERALAAGADEPFDPSVGRALSTLANVPAMIALLHAEVARQRRDPERATRFARQALASLTREDHALHAMVRWELAMVEAGRPDPLAVSAHYLSPPVPGPARVAVTLLRAGRSVSVLRATLSQDVAARLELLVSAGQLDGAAEPLWRAEGPPELPPPDQCVPGRSRCPTACGCPSSTTSTCASTRRPPDGRSAGRLAARRCAAGSASTTAARPTRSLCCRRSTRCPRSASSSACWPGRRPWS